MPVLSLHNTYSLPSGSASYTLGLSGAPVGSSSHTYQTTGSMLGGATSGLANLSMNSTLPANLGYTSSSYSTYTNPLLSSGPMSMKLKPLDEIDMGRYSNPGANRSGTPLSPIPSNSWALDSYGAGGLDGVNPTFMHTSVQRPLSRLGGLDLDSELTKCDFEHIKRRHFCTIDFVVTVTCIPSGVPSWSIVD